MKITFTPPAWKDYLWWQENDRAALRRTNRLIDDITRNGHEGIGKPEPLRGDLQGLWSRRITSEHRLIYVIEEDSVTIFACRFHYQ
ncbi:Txe/YoeB family addiction module toxin [Nocardia sp. NPDC055321]